MPEKKSVYKNPQAGSALLTVICSGCRTPILDVKFSTLVNPFYYQNSPGIARYSVTCSFNPEEHKEFLKGILNIEKNEKVDSILKNETTKKEGEYVNTGNILIKFQTKEVIPIYLTENKETLEPFTRLELEDELARGEKIMIIYDILRYTKKNTAKVDHGLSFRPSCIYYFPKDQ